MEYGAGRGELSRYLAKALHSRDVQSGSFLLVDRDIPSHKFDSQLRSDAVLTGSREPVLKRIKTDIANLRLSNALHDLFSNVRSTIIISKHLCGAATDLAINSALVGDVSAVLIGVCCHQLCEYDSYPLQGRKWLSEHGIGTKATFNALKSLASWAVSGRRESYVDTAHASGKTLEERTECGRQAKMILNFGRVHALECAGFDATLVHYVPRQVTPENVLLIAVHREKGGLSR